MEEQPKSDDEGQLVAGLAVGRESAFAELFDRFGARLYRTALGMLAHSEDAEDCVQEVFAALVRGRKRLSDVRDLAAYLFAALRRQVGRRLSARARDPGNLVVDLAGPERSPRDPRSEALRRALGGLPAEQREVIALKIEGELTFDQIARALGISPNTAASRYRYALARLRDRLKDC